MKLTKFIKRSLFLLSFFMFIGFNTVSACEIEVDVVSGQKDVYKEGDIVVLHVKVEFTHRVCPVAIEKTKYDSKGIKIMQGTPWKETSPGIWERKLKVKIEKTKNGKLFLSVTRDCEKDGGFGEITLHA